MSELGFASLVAGFVSYLLALLIGVIPLAYIAFRLRLTATKSFDEEGALRDGNRAVAIHLGAVMLCQAILARHAVFAIMAIGRSLLVEELSAGETVGVLLRSFVMLIGLSALAMLSIWFAEQVFSWLTKGLDEQKAIQNGNVAMAIFFSLVLLAITIVLNDGMEDFSRSLIPYVRSGVAPWS